jgi:hypothetical protein
MRRARASATGCCDGPSDATTPALNNRLELTINELGGGSTPLALDVGALRGAGLCGRDREAARREQERRRAAGEPWHSSDLFTYRIGRYLATTGASIEVQGPLTGGEAEAVAIFVGDQVLIGVGSDQCDRELDRLFLEKPKQLCPHPLGRQVWRYADVKDHWDELRVEAEVETGGQTVAIQSFALAELVDFGTLLAADALRERPDGTVFYCGTGGAPPGAEDEIARLGLPPETISGVGEVFRMRLHDPVRDRELRHEYRVEVLGDNLADRAGEAS